AHWALVQSNAFMTSLGLQMNGTPWATIDRLGHQKVLLNYIDPGTGPISALYSGSSNADVAQIVLNAVPPSVPVEPDNVSHEYGHALLDSIRRSESLHPLAGYKEAGAINEGMSDLFTIAFNHKQLASPTWWCFNGRDSSAPAPALNCLENIRDPILGLFTPPPPPAPEPQLSGQPERVGDALYRDYSAEPAVNCKPATNDTCGSRLDATIISHGGYLLGAGSEAER